MLKLLQRSLRLQIIAAINHGLFVIKLQVPFCCLNTGLPRSWIIKPLDNHIFYALFELNWARNIGPFVTSDTTVFFQDSSTFVQSIYVGLNTRCYVVL